MMNNKKTVLKAVFILALVFIIGFLAGIGSVAVFWNVRMRSLPFMGNPVQTMQRLTKVLNLNEKQQSEIGQIVRQTRNDLKFLRDEVRPKIQQRLEQVQQQIASLLTDEQKIKFTQLVERRKLQLHHWQERRSRWMGDND
jgi:Spy/CpxP family protein refolding chaperone